MRKKYERIDPSYEEARRIVKAYNARAMTIEAHNCNDTYKRLGWCWSPWECYLFQKRCFQIVRQAKKDAEAEIEWQNAWLAERLCQHGEQ